MLTILVTIVSTLFVETLITYAIGARRFGFAWPVKVYRTPQSGLILHCERAKPQDVES